MPKDYKQSYECWTRPLRSHQNLSRVLLSTNKALTYLGYAIYPLLIAILLVRNDDFLAKAVIVPAFGFVLVSAIRHLVDKPRPYEAFDIDPLIKKDTHGKSFPSRHAFCMTMIAMTWLSWFEPVGICLLVASFAMGMVRVLGGVHYPIDVASGMAIALLLGIVGYWVV